MWGAGRRKNRRREGTCLCRLRRCQRRRATKSATQMAWVTLATVVATAASAIDVCGRDVNSTKTVLLLACGIRVGEDPLSDEWFHPRKAT